jgi:hypothetical protein
MTLDSEREQQIARANEIAATLPGPDLPGWVHVQPGPQSWAPRLVHTGGASVMVTCVGARLLLRAVRPDALSVYQWEALEISVAADSTRSRIVSHFTRRLATPLLPQHASAMGILQRQEQAHQARDRVCAQLRQLIPASVLSRPWPADVHDARWHASDLGRPGHTGRVRVVAADHVDLTLESLTPEQAATVLTALFWPAARTDTPVAAPSPDGAAPDDRTGQAQLLAGFPPVKYPDVSTAMLPKIEMDTIGQAPTMVAVFEHGAWVHTVGAGEADERQDQAWAGWPHLRALLLHAAAAGAGWVLLDTDGALPVSGTPLTVHDW